MPADREQGRRPAGRRSEDLRFSRHRPEERWHPHRRRTDRPGAEAAPEEQKPRWGTRGREFLRRFRDPIIGLSVAGAAAPLIRAGEQPSEAGGPEGVAEAAAAGRLRARGDLEEGIAERFGGRPERERERNERITRAMERFGISRDLAERIHDIAAEEGVDPEVAFGLVRTESSFKDHAVSHVGARGLTQVMPKTAEWLQPGTSPEDLFRPETNLRIGFRYLRSLIEKYDGDLRLALLAYNRGPGTVDRILNQGGDPDNGYADKVLSG